MKKPFPLTLSIFSVILFTVSAITLHCGDFMNPFPPKVKTAEAFQHDLEPIIIAAYNEFLTAENFMAYKNGYQIDIYSKRGETICSFQSCAFFFAGLDIDYIRDTYNKYPLPLEFRLSEKRWISGGAEPVNFLWTNEEYHAVATSTTRLGKQTAMLYYTQGAPTDGSTGNPPQFIDQLGRIPDQFGPNLPPADQK